MKLRETRGVDGRLGGCEGGLREGCWIDCTTEQESSPVLCSSPASYTSDPSFSAFRSTTERRASASYSLSTPRDQLDLLPPHSQLVLDYTTLIEMFRNALRPLRSAAPAPARAALRVRNSSTTPQPPPKP